MDDFSILGLGEKSLRALEECGYDTPTKIQREAIVSILSGRDVLGLAATGTGKTAAFVLPILDLLHSGVSRGRMPRCLILEPTRELANQVYEKILLYGKYHDLKSVLLIGGIGYKEQATLLRDDVDIIVSTPGRLMDHFDRGNVLLSGLNIFILDEADRMLDMGFIPTVEKLMHLTINRKQTLCFSATMLPDVENLCRGFLKNHQRIEVARPVSGASTIEEKFSLVSLRDKKNHIALYIREEQKAKRLTNAIIFCNRKQDVVDLNGWLEKKGFQVASLHGDLNQHLRLRVLEEFRANIFMLLVASDVAARGLDIPAVSHVINYDVPEHTSYIHRIGRTGRAGRQGYSLTLVTEKQLKGWKNLCQTIGNDVLSWNSSLPSTISSSTKSGKKKSPSVPKKVSQRSTLPKASDHSVLPSFITNPSPAS